MKTMNYLFLMTLLIFSTSCTNYSPLGNNGSEEEPLEVYFEFDFYQESLESEARVLQEELTSIEMEIESGDSENQGLLDGLQNRLARNEQNQNWNQSIAEETLVFRTGGVRPPRCEEGEDFQVLKPCPLPRFALDNFLLASEQWASGGDIIVTNIEGEVVGKLQGMTEVENSNGTLLKAEIEFDAESAHEVVITNRDVEGQIRNFVYTLQ